MNIETKMHLSGSAAQEFYQQMLSPDMNAIEARDKFLSDVSDTIDEEEFSMIVPDISLMPNDAIDIKPETSYANKQLVYDISVMQISDFDSENYVQQYYEGVCSDKKDYETSELNEQNSSAISTTIIFAA